MFSVPFPSLLFSSDQHHFLTIKLRQNHYIIIIIKLHLDTQQLCVAVVYSLCGTDWEDQH